MKHNRLRRHILDCPRVEVGQLPLLTHIGLRAFGEAGPLKYGMSRRKYYERLHGINCDIYRFVLFGANDAVTEANVCGLIGVIPMNKTVYDAYIRGELSQFEFGADHVLPHDHAGPCDLYLQTVYLGLPHYRLMRRLLRGLMRAMSELSRGGIDGHGPGGGVRIYAEGVTDAGRQIMKAFEMRLCGCSKDRNPTYVIHTYPGKPLILSTSRKLLNTEMQGYATPQLVSHPEIWDEERNRL